MIIHKFIQYEINKQLGKVVKNNKLKSYFNCTIEKNITCLNASGRKKCDIIIFNNENPIVVIPLKFICRNFKQNKNNYLESLVGETYLLKQKHDSLVVIPINIFITNCNYYNKQNEIKKQERVTKKDICVYDKIPIFDNCFNYLIDVDYEKKIIKKINGKFDLIQTIINYTY
jgi:hypothetical protein